MAAAHTVTNWTPDRLPPLEGRSYIITGGNSGIGLEAAIMLARAGASVTLACRNPDKAAAAAQRILSETGAEPGVVILDLASMASIRRAAEEVRTSHSKIDGLINNAGIMQTPELKTEDGFELQLGSNHLGHFLWTGLLLDRVQAASGRIVTVSSVAHKYGEIHLDDLMLEQGYSPTIAYCQSKLANLMFALELQRRLAAKGSQASSIACHPGYSGTALQSTGPTGFLNFIYKITNALLAQPAEKGAIPTVLAAAGEEAQSGGYYGPTGWQDAGGPVGDASIAGRALKEDVAAALWEKSEALVGLRWPS
jgi:NAD(P)-dependent dehydrogenase (short-subunit alcohol dehydrogenase family)